MEAELLKRPRQPFLSGVRCHLQTTLFFQWHSPTLIIVSQDLNRVLAREKGLKRRR